MRAQDLLCKADEDPEACILKWVTPSARVLAHACKDLAHHALVHVSFVEWPYKVKQFLRRSLWQA